MTVKRLELKEKEIADLRLPNMKEVKMIAILL